MIGSTGIRICTIGVVCTAFYVFTSRMIRSLSMVSEIELIADARLASPVSQQILAWAREHIVNQHSYQLDALLNAYPCIKSVQIRKTSFSNAYMVLTLYEPKLVCMYSTTAQILLEHGRFIDADQLTGAAVAQLPVIHPIHQVPDHEITAATVAWIGQVQASPFGQFTCHWHTKTYIAFADPVDTQWALVAEPSVVCDAHLYDQYQAVKSDNQPFRSMRIADVRFSNQIVVYNQGVV